MLIAIELISFSKVRENELVESKYNSIFKIKQWFKSLIEHLIGRKLNLFWWGLDFRKPLAKGLFAIFNWVIWRATINTFLYFQTQRKAVSSGAKPAGSDMLWRLWIAFRRIGKRICSAAVVGLLHLTSWRGKCIWLAGSDALNATESIVVRDRRRKKMDRWNTFIFPTRKLRLEGVIKC